MAARQSGSLIWVTVHLVLTLFILPCAALRAQPATPDPLFSSDELLNITLTAPFRQIDRERDKKAEYAGALSYTDSEGAPVVLNIKLQVRGNYRLDPKICRYSQLWLNIRTGQAEGTLFENQDKLKLVMQCRDNDRYAGYIAREQQAYVMYRRLSALSLGTRLLSATYIDSDNPDRRRTHLAFFVEHQDRLAERSGMESVDLERINVNNLDPEQSSLVALFMFLIGNTDFSLVKGALGEECCHNAKLLVDSRGIYHPIPYDFDASGFVDADYAAGPKPSLKISSNRQRLFRGYCAHQAALAVAIGRLQEARDALLSIASDTRYPGTGAAERSVDYLSAFYAIIGDQASRQKRIINDCRG